MSSEACLNVNNVTISGEVTAIKETKSGEGVMTLRQKVGRVYNFFTCTMNQDIIRQAIADIVPMDHVIITGILGNWANTGSKYKVTIIRIKQIVVVGKDDGKEKVLESIK